MHPWRSFTKNGNLLALQAMGMKIYINRVKFYIGILFPTIYSGIQLG